jgi:signal peptide peptidase SppA
MVRRNFLHYTERGNEMNMMREFRRALRSMNGKVMAYQLRDGFGSGISGLLERTARGQRVHDAEIFEAFAADDTTLDAMNARATKLAAPSIIPSGNTGKSIAVVSMRGVAMYDCEYQPICFSTLNFARCLNALTGDETIGTIILDCDSPGGMVIGTPEAGDAVWAARQAGKKIVAVVSPLCASAAYWICSQADEIIAVPSADIGSVGVFMLHMDCSKMMEDAGIKPTFIFADDCPYKVEGNPYEPLGEEAFNYYKGETNITMAQFAKAISRGRSIPVAKVLSDFGQGRTLAAPDAKKAGMIDRIATLDVALSRFGVCLDDSEESRCGRKKRGEQVEQVEQVPPADEQPQDAIVAAVEPNTSTSARARRIALLSA